MHGTFLAYKEVGQVTAATRHLPGQQVERVQGVDAAVLAAEQPRDRLPVAAVGRAATRRPAVALALQVHLRDSTSALILLVAMHTAAPGTWCTRAPGEPAVTRSDAMMSCARFEQLP